MVLNVAVVEDDVKIFEGLRGYLNRFSKSADVQINLHYFPDALKFLNDYRPVYHLVFMDINLPYMDGMTASHKLRKLDNQIFIIFVTDLRQYAIKGYEVDAIDYIVKPVIYDHLELKLMKIVNLVKKQNNDVKIPIKTDDGVIALGTDDIKYIEIANHYLYYHTNNKVFKGYGSLNKIQSKLPSNLFSRCNDCYLVNLKFVTRIGKNSVFLGEEELAMSRLKKKSFLSAFTQFLGENS